MDPPLRMDPKMDPKMDTRKISAQRLPPPVLFQGPPSHNASNLSLPPPVSAVPTTGASPRPPLQRNRSSRAGTLEAPGSLSPFLTRKQSKGEVDGSEAIWQEMQSALSEVELSAATGEHVFGEKHSEALEDLRTKQLKLAQAWARSEAGDEVVETKGAAAAAAATAKSNASLRPASRSTAGPGDSANPEDGSSRNLDEETEKDILLARERREANDRYFDRVNNGVLDVVAKLEEVAQAMRAVERESKDIWSDTDSMSTTTQTTTDTG
ncbi:hypothetical protein AtubIFM57258_006796 [Aspergillus tubingensis]|uniref:Uncharacterized protein n=1 Tax=Aspergillus neoniger (strain CBS 115656) TaxID=1448310 RepID=A0A318YE99_ASPNB|nr:hypothetical protein BO87DRAFT_377850 [Aspergillus neoniger CBS 115656]PYH32775.1 hypothetical protein BO87DRAFT_377850 [Aspergillus neoniger CBS 115656]GLB10390.1 hypothetical protein AtubIFM57258_006796 [Aspergillus tubingensis]